MVRGPARGARRALLPQRRTGAPLLAILAGLLLAACGQRGPLYYPVPPAEPPPRVRTPSSGTVVVPPPGAPRPADTPARRTD